MDSSLRWNDESSGLMSAHAQRWMWMSLDARDEYPFRLHISQPQYTQPTAALEAFKVR